MKVIRHVPDFALYQHLQKTLPSSLEAQVWSDGYEVDLVIVKAGEKCGFFHTPDEVARIGRQSVKLCRPEYASDFEDAIRSFESARDVEVTLHICEQG